MDNRHLKVVASNESIDRNFSKKEKSSKEPHVQSISPASGTLTNFVMGLFYLIWVLAMATSLVTMPMVFGFMAGAEWASLERMHIILGTSAIISIAGFFIFVIKKMELNTNA